MDSDVKRQLDLRFARGEISKKEYTSVLQTLRQNDDGFSSLLSVFSKVKAALFEEYEAVVPTDDSPLMVSDELGLWGSHFIYKGRRFNYSAVRCIGYMGKKEYVNGVLQAYTGELHIWPSEEELRISACRSFGLGKKREIPVKRLENAYVFLTRITFDQRLRRYLYFLERDGHIPFGHGVQLQRDGCIQKGNLRISLKEAYRKDMIKFGSRGLFSEDPDTVIIGDTGISILDRRIKFFLWIDKDVVKSIMLGLAAANVT